MHQRQPATIAPFIDSLRYGQTQQGSTHIDTATTLKDATLKDATLKDATLTSASREKTSVASKVMNERCERTLA
ncbi:hypothetical protein N9B17_01585 [Rhodopirellula sp.]|nr:hypothetical protein [Rhodopirellula sp.]